MKASQQAVSNLTTGALGLALGLLVVGPPMGDGALLNLDLLAVGHLEVPRSLVALGPEIPRRAPLQAAWALLSPPLSAAEALRLWMILIVAVATAGMARYLRELAAPVALGAAGLYGLSPFLVTRLGVGHLGFATAVALLPWAAGTLLRPVASGRTTLLWLAGFALCGYFGALVAGPLVLAGLLNERRLPGVGPAVAAVGTQVPWLIPALASVGDATGAAASESFETDFDDLASALLLLVGHGFWRGSNQLGTTGAVAVLAAALLAVLAWAGVRWAGGPHRWSLVGLGLVGLGITLASRVPGIETAYDQLTRRVVFAPIREGQRLLVFTVFAVVVLAGRGLDLVLTGRPRPVRIGSGMLLGGAALTLAWPSLWGLDGAATDHAVPADWQRADQIVDADPGLTLALPWSQYFDVAIADGRRAHHPVPALVGGDVVFRHDLGLGATDRISRDAREEAAALLVRALRFGQDVSPHLEALGVSWIVALPDLDDGDIARLRDLDAVETILDGPSIAVFDGPGGAGGSLTAWNATASAIVVADIAWLAGVGAVALSRRRGPRCEQPAVQRSKLQFP